MKSFAKSLLGLAAAYALALPAQALPPVSKEVKLDAKVKQASDEEQYQHGMRLILKMKDGKRIVGTLVLADDAENYMLIRTRPGVLPVKVSGKNIAEIDRIRLTSSTGKVLPDEPEILDVMITNGDTTKVKYFAPALSGKERSYLSSLETSQNDLARAQAQMAIIDEALRGEMQSLRTSLEFQVQGNKLLNDYLMYLASGWFPMAMWSPYVGYTGGTAMSNGNPGTSVTLGNLLTMQTAMEKHVTQARENLAKAQSHAYYEGDRLIAILPEERVVMPHAIGRSD